MQTVRGSIVVLSFEFEFTMFDLTYAWLLWLRSICDVLRQQGQVGQDRSEAKERRLRTRSAQPPLATILILFV